MVKHARLLGLVLLVTGVAMLPHPRCGAVAWAQGVDEDAAAGLQSLYKSTPSAKMLGDAAKGVLVFPNIVKAGFIVGAKYGEGTLFKAGSKVANYNVVAASYGFQAGVQVFGYAMFLMTDSALDYLDRSAGWEVGVGPSVVVLDRGAAQKLTTSTLQSDVYAIVFGQKGLMAGVGIQGSKITRINR